MANSFTSFLQSFVGKPVKLIGSDDRNKNLQQTVIPVQLARIVQTIGNYRDATKEAEYGLLPYRVKMQQMYNDLQDEPHTAACIERRMSLTMMREFALKNKSGKIDEQWTEWLRRSTWFDDFVKYTMMAIFRGYNLISMGDIIDDGLPQIRMIEPSVVSPDRLVVSSVIYMPTGSPFTEGEYKDWHIWVSTPPDIGRANCGYGLLHKIAIPIILIRSNLSDNANFNEKFGMPIVHGKTTKSDDDERQSFYNQLRNMGSSATFLTDISDEISFIERSLGEGYKTYADLEMRMQKLISKNILGHADALDSIPKRSGATEGNSQTPTTPVAQALANIQSQDGKFIEPYINQLLDKLRMHGVSLPKDLRFEYSNDLEEKEVVRARNEQNLQVADLAYKMKQAGLQMDAKYFEEQTKIPTKTVERNIPNEIPNEISNKLTTLYNHKH